MTEPTAAALNSQPEPPVTTVIPPALAAGPVAADASAERTKAVLNLDTMEREGAAGPFDFIHQGKRYLMSDPQEVDWQNLLAAMSNPHMFFRLVLPPEDHVEFFTTLMPTWKMNTLMKRYQDHYGIPSLPNAGGLLR